MIGFLNIYKPSGITSNAVVSKVKKILKIKKVGHMGTLDPMACGILPIAIGKATRLFDYCLSKTKTYIAIFDFGYTTDSLDVTGNITDRDETLVSLGDIKEVLPSFIGKINQIPPKFSAKNINGRRAYDLARDGIEFELKSSEIEIKNIEVLEQVDLNRFKFKIYCSSGTYIRSIARDIATKLNTYGCMRFLERIETGNFDLSTSINYDDLSEDKIYKNIISPLKVFENFDIIKLDKESIKILKDGKTLPYNYINNNSFILCNDKIIGVVRKDKDYLKIDTYLEEENYD